jgi:hypothetical protein
MQEDPAIGPDGFLATPDDPLFVTHLAINDYMSQSLPDVPWPVIPTDYAFGIKILKASESEQLAAVRAILVRLLWLRKNWSRDVNGGEATPGGTAVEVGGFGSTLRPLLKRLLLRKLPWQQTDLLLLASVAAAHTRCYSSAFVSPRIFIGHLERFYSERKVPAKLVEALETLRARLAAEARTAEDRKLLQRIDQLKTAR